MPCTPEDFLGVAKFVGASANGEVGALQVNLRRAAVSRSYYSCFHAAQALIAARNLSDLSEGGVHARVIAAIKNLQDSDPKFKALAYKIFANLQSLKAKRVTADYELHGVIDGLICMQSIDMSQRTLDLISKCMPVSAADAASTA
jgi:uncharacterized protein (UPF0332 family)